MKHKIIVDMYLAFSPNLPFTPSTVLSWLNEVEGAIMAKVMRPALAVTMVATIGVATYALPIGVPFHHIENLSVDGEQYPKIDGTLQDTMGFYDAGDNKFGIYPVPAGTETIKLTHTSPYIPSTTLNYTTTEALLESPFDSAYLAYIQAQGEFALRQYSAYNNIASVFNAKFEDFVSWWNDRNPFSRRDTKCFRLPVLLSELPQKPRT